MDEDTNFSKFTYRQLQKLAKSMQLPSKVTKLELIQLIHAKKHGTEAHVKEVVQRVRLERHFTGQVINRMEKKSTSDRVLRSVNKKIHIRPMYTFLNDKFKNVVYGVIKAPMQKSNSEDGTSQEGYGKLSLMTKSMVRNFRPSLMGGASCLNRSNQLMPASGREICRNLSKDKPQTCPEALLKNSNFEYVQNFGFRRNDGKISKINAMVLKSIQTKPAETYKSTENACSNIVVTIQDIINSNIAQTYTPASEYGLSESTVTAPYPNTSTTNATEYSGLNDMETPVSQNALPENENDLDEWLAAYIQKKRRAEQVKQRMQRVPMLESETRLPKIGDVTEPLYVQVEDSEMPDETARCARTTPIVRSLVPARPYNFKPSMSVHAPLMPVNTHTTCTYTTPVSVAAVAQPSIDDGEMPPDSLYEQDRQYQYQYSSTYGEISRMCKHLEMAEQDDTYRKYHEALGILTSSSSQESQDKGPSVDEMLDDAMELIRQDGNYMERISLDATMQCILCTWVGPKSALDLHVAKDHASDIVEQDFSNWNAPFRFGSLTEQPLWLSEVRELDGRRYAVSVKLQADWLLVSLSTLTRDPAPKIGTLTIFKVNGKPYSWEGPIKLLPTNMPYENDGNFLRVAVDELDLVPRNPRMKNTNKVAGRLDLKDAYFIVFVKIM